MKIIKILESEKDLSECIDTNALTKSQVITEPNNTCLPMSH